MPSTQQELEVALKAFRLDVVKALANIHVEIETLQAAVVEAKPVSREHLKELRETVAKRLRKFRDHYDENIGPTWGPYPAQTPGHH